MDDEHVAEFLVEYESTELGRDYVYGHMPIYGKDDLGDGERFEFNCDFLPPKITVPVSNSHATVAFRRGSKNEPVELDDAVLDGEFAAEVIGIEVMMPCFKLTTVGDGTEVARLFIHPDHLPEWLGSEGDSCFIKLRLEYDHERTLENCRVDSVPAEEKYREWRREEQELISDLKTEYGK